MSLAYGTILALDTAAMAEHPLSKDLRQVSRPRFERLDIITTRKRAPAWHVLLSRRSDQVKYHLNLIEIAVSGENRLSLEHLTKNTSTTTISARADDD